MANFLLIHLSMIAYIFIYDRNYLCEKFYTNIYKKYGCNNIFPFLAIFSIEFYYFTPK